MLAAPANGLADGLITGIIVNVSWTTTIDGTSPYPMNSSVWQLLPSGHLLLAENATVAASHVVQIGPFAYSSFSCPSVGCEIRLIVKSCDTSTSVCVNSSSEPSPFSIVVGPSINSSIFIPVAPKTGDLVNISWFTLNMMNGTITWSGGSNSHSAATLSHNLATSQFNGSSTAAFTLYGCANGVCENQSLSIGIGYSASAVTFSSTLPAVNITASWTTHANSNSTFSYSLNGAGYQNLSDGAFSTSHSASLGNFSTGDVLNYTVRSCLAPYNCEERSDSVTIGPPPTTTTTVGGGGGSGGPGGSGGSGGFYIPPAENVTVIPAGADFASRQVPANSLVSYEFNGSNQAIITVNFRYTSFVRNATIILLKLSAEPKLSELPAGMAYQYVNLTHPQLSASQIVPPAYLIFRVPKSWVTGSNIDASTIGMSRYSGGIWQALETEKTGEDATYLYFKAKSPGLSLFAITGQRRTAFWDLIGLIEQYYSGAPGVDFWKVLDALTAYYSSGGM
jgi:PGF-pre-PGF domain-containing protein